MEASVVNPAGVNPAGFAQMQRAMRANSQVFRDAAASTGMFETQQLRLTSATEDMTAAIEKQKLSFRKWARERKVFQAAYKEQLALQQMTVRQMPGSAGGKKVYDVVIPTEVHKDFDTFRQKIGFINEALKSGATQMVNWGKNTQWAGRQLMVGFTMPVVAFGAATGVLAYQVDKEMTRIQKVYDTTAKEVAGDAGSMIAVEHELASVRESAMQTARTAAQEYGASVTDTLSVQAELAAQGKKGAELQAATNEVMRIATLGEFEHADALKTVTALTSIMGYTAEEVGKQLDYMNSIENATSLATQDFAKAIPIALGPLKEMGGNVQDLAMLLVAMKERGIQAGEGANAIKAMMQRLYRPSKQIREEWEAITKTDITAIRDDNKGNIMGMLNDIVDATENLGRAEKVQVLGGLIGTYQVGRINSVLSGIRDIGKETAQTTAVLEVNEQGWKEWGKTADREIERWQNSASGMFKVALESVKAELSIMGEPFLEIGAQVLSVVADLVKAFNQLPEGVKKFAAGAAIFMAIVGPMVMLTGLSANFLGNFIKMGASILTVATRFKLLNKESAAAQLAASLTTSEYIKGVTAVETLTAAVNKLTLANREAALAAHGIMLNEFRPNIIDKSTGKDTGRSAAVIPETGIPSRYNLNERVGLMPVPGKVAPAADDVENARKHSAFVQSGATSMGIMAIASGTMLVNSNETVDKWAEMAMYAAELGPAIIGMGQGLRALPWAAMATTVKGKVLPAVTSMRAALARGIVPALGAGLTSLGAMVGVAGAATVGLAAAGVAAYKIYKHIHAAGDEWDAIHNNAEGFAEIYGYTYQESKPYDVNNPDEGARMDAVNAIRSKYGELVNAIDDAGSAQEKFNIAMEAGLQVINTGGTTEQAKQAVTDALEAAESLSREQAEAIVLEFKAKLNFDDSEVLLEGLSQSADSALDEAINSMEDKGFWERMFSGPGDLAEKTSDQMQTVGERAREAYEAGMNSGKGATPYLELVSDQLEQIDALIAKQEASGTIDVAEMERLAALRRTYIEEQLRAAGKSGDDIDSLSDDWLEHATALEIVDKAYGSLTDAERRAWEERQNRPGAGLDFGVIADAAGNVNDAIQKYALLALRNANAQSKVTGELRNSAAAAYDVNAQMEAYKAADWSSAYQSAMTDTQSSIVSSAQDTFSSRMNAAMDAYRSGQQGRLDALDAAQENATAAFENRWERRKEAVENAFDQRIEKINEAIEAEEKADEIRERIFNAEIQRMQRLAEMQNNNIDFNVAVNSGDLDEAAKIRNDMQAKETEWALGDASERAGRQSERRQERLGNRADRLEELKDKRLDHLDEIEERERAAMERRQEAVRDALQQEVDANIAAQEAIWESRKENLDKAIKEFQAFVPKNEEELRAHIARIQNKYGIFNENTKEMFGRSSKKVGELLADNVMNAAREIRSEVQWAGVGQDIARKMIMGAFGMTTAQFQNWMVTGKWPKGVDMTKVDYNSLPGVAGSGQGQKDAPVPVLHTGGIVGKDKGGYAGFRKGHPDEVDATLLKGEGVLNRKAMSMLGETGFHALNHGIGGSGYADAMGMAGIMGGMMFRAVTNTLGLAAYNGASKAQKKSVAKKLKGSGSSSGSFVQGKGGWAKPSVPGRGWSNTHDYRNPIGSPLYAVSDGVITDSRAITSGGSPGNGLYSTPYRSYGETIAMRTSSGDVLRYAHLNPGGRFVRVGQQVKGGSLIGRSGNTGNSSGPHTHFDVNGNYNASGWLAAHGVSLRKGAQNIKWDNTIANLHKGEAVLTEDINNQFRKGVEKFAEGPNAQYNLYMTINGSDLDEDKVVNKTMTAIRRIEMRKPQNRTGK